MKALNKAPKWEKSPIRNNLQKALAAGQSMTQGMFKVSSLVPILITPLKDLALQKFIKETTTYFYALWDALLTWAGPVLGMSPEQMGGVRVLADVLETVCATGNVLLEWLCSGAEELVEDVWFWVTQQLREVGRTVIVSIIQWVANLATQYIIEPLVSTASSVLKAVDKAIAATTQAVKEGVSFLDSIVPQKIKDFFKRIFNMVKDKVAKRIGGDKAEAAAALYRSVENFLLLPHDEEEEFLELEIEHQQF